MMDPITETECIIELKEEVEADKQDVLKRIGMAFADIFKQAKVPRVRDKREK